MASILSRLRSRPLTPLHHSDQDCNMSSFRFSHSSDLSQSVVCLSRRSDLIGYRNVLSYASALGIPIFSESAVELHHEPIGQGSRSATFRGILHEPGKDRAVAVKQPNISFTRDKAEEEESIQHRGLSSIIQEVRILADPKLRSHPNLPHVVGAFFKLETSPEGIRPCVIFELATSDFATFLRVRPQTDVDTREVLSACSQIANGLCALHAYGLVHGDIKPENILMFERDGEVIATVADLGTCGTPSQEEIIVGTQTFWAPECHLKSSFRAFANRPSRDVYSFGLIAFAAALRYREHPFPNDIEEQFSIQHSSDSCSETLLSKMPQTSDADAAFREIVRLCVRSEPVERPSMFAVAGMIEKTMGITNTVQIMQDVAESVFLTDPVQPRLNILEQMPLPEHLRSKLHAEFLILARDAPSVRTALTLAAFYGGVFGEKYGSSQKVVAKTQWLLKAVELGSYATLNACVEN
ncbi:kinase-like domain-containing protein [Clohesyomyces aquaticus]|uniref:Kinase-like domain-containing protein n=1 Tax=Clohesyomyces aquaticus TaxID=1231657 RepID=A0A1Y1YIB6_9PLEO|nr:kinase-like domain-containing protein [Clohesyomyces aquaticus]